MTANFIINAISIAVNYDYTFAKELITKYPIITLFQNALSCGQFGTGSLSIQLAMLQSKHTDLLPIRFDFPTLRTPISGIRQRFLQNHMLHPTIFNAWL